MVLAVAGSFRAEPGYAVEGEWRVERDSTARFESSRHELFSFRRSVLPSFAIYWLLRDIIDANRYVVLGLYGQRDDLELCRDHPDIVRFAAAHPAASYGAVPNDSASLLPNRVRLAS